MCVCVLFCILMFLNNELLSNGKDLCEEFSNILLLDSTENTKTQKITAYIEKKNASSLTHHASKLLAKTAHVIFYFLQIITKKE